MENPLPSTHSGQRGALSAPVPPQPLSVLDSRPPPPVHPLSPRVQASACKCLSRLSWERESFALEPQGCLRYRKEKCSIQQLSGSHILPASSCLDLWPRSKVLNEGGTPTSLFKAQSSQRGGSLQACPSASLYFCIMEIQGRNPEAILPRSSSESSCPSSYLQGSWGIPLP